MKNYLVNEGIYVIPVSKNILKTDQFFTEIFNKQLVDSFKFIESLSIEAILYLLSNYKIYLKDIKCEYRFSEFDEKYLGEYKFISKSTKYQDLMKTFQQILKKL